MPGSATTGTGPSPTTTSTSSTTSTSGGTSTTSSGSPQHVRDVSATEATHSPSEEHDYSTTPFDDDHTPTISGSHNETDEETCQDMRRVEECAAEFMNWADPKKLHGHGTGEGIGAVLDRMKDQNASNCRPFWEMSHCIRDNMPCIKDMLYKNTSAHGKFDTEDFFTGFSICAGLKKEDILPVWECRKPLFNYSIYKPDCWSSVGACKDEPHTKCPPDKWCDQKFVECQRDSLNKHCSGPKKLSLRQLRVSCFYDAFVSGSACFPTEICHVLLTSGDSLTSHGEKQCVGVEEPKRHYIKINGSQHTFAFSLRTASYALVFLEGPVDFKEYKKERFKVFVVSLASSGRYYVCTCPEGSKKEPCKHATMIMCALTDFYEYPAEVTAQLMKTNRKSKDNVGRRPLAQSQHRHAAAE